jgi:hypothetical protein
VCSSIRIVGIATGGARSWVLAMAICGLGAGIGCGKSKVPSSGASQSSEGEPEAPVVVTPMDAREASQWAAAAAQGEPEELMRLEDLVGCDGLRDRAREPNLRLTAIHAMQYCTDFSELPWLVELAAEKNDTEARAALEAIDELAARRRAATDPEDAEELHAGCGGLLDIARSTSHPRERRVLAIGALRMLSERGCVKRGEIPTNLDVK